MKKVYSSQDTLRLGHLKNLLETQGIECVIRNLDLTSLPPVECWPELWVVDDHRYAEAQAILRETLSPIVLVKKPWKCRRCGEEIEGQFAKCWNCGSSRIW